MKWKLLSLFLFPLLVQSAQLRYEQDIKKHKQAFLEWIASEGRWEEYTRVRLGISCNDADAIPKQPGAGALFQEGAVSYQLMHNGIKVVKDGYCGAWMTDLIYGLQGHNEPQEERAFYEVLKYLPSHATMIELGSYWAYYSLWFAKTVAHPINYLVEPDLERLELGKQNFALNGASGFFLRGYVGECNTDAGDFIGARQLFIDSFLEEQKIEHVHILHSDIQGSEYAMLQSAVQSIESKKIDYFFISTHSGYIHGTCIDFLKSYEYVILAEHSPEESFSVDGLIVARRADVFGPESIPITKHLIKSKE